MHGHIHNQLKRKMCHLKLGKKNYDDGEVNF